MRIRGLPVTFGVAALVGVVACGAPEVGSAPAPDSSLESADTSTPQAAATGSSRAVPGDPESQEAEGFEWFWAINGPVSADAASGLSVDAEGNVFIAGAHSGLDMDQDGVVDLESGATAYHGASNSFFMKLSRGPADDRVRLRWTRSPRNPADRTASKIAADSRGGAYVSGAFAESISFEGGPTLPGRGSNDAYVARYDADGSVIWARVWGGPGDGDAIQDLASDREANAYVVGAAGGTFALDDRGAEFRGRSVGLVSYGPDGVVRWARIFGPGAPSPGTALPVWAYNVVVAPNGEVVVTGRFEVAPDFDGDGVTDLPAPTDRDGFIAWFDSEGTFVGARAFEGPVGLVTFDPDGDLFLASAVGDQVEQAFGPADFDGDGRADVEPRGGYPIAPVIARYSPEGHLKWVRSYTLETPADMEVRGGRIALSGNYHGVRDLDEDGVPEKRLDAPEHVDKETDLAILILSAEDGTPEEVWTAPGPGNDWANTVAFSPTEPALYVAGSIQITADFTGDGERGEGWVVCENRGDVFFAQYRLGERLAEARDERPAEQPREERPAEQTREIGLGASLAEREGRLEADLAWSGATAERIDVYRNDELIVTVANDGSHTDVIPREVARSYRYRVCDAGTTRCSSTVQARF